MTSIVSKTVAIVTGGSSGLGAAATKFLLKHNARVVVADLNRQAFDAMIKSVQIERQEVQLLDLMSSSSAAAVSQGPAVAFCKTDVTEAGQVSAALDQVEACFGEPVNAAISCAGIAVATKTFSTKHGPHSLEDFARVLNINTVGTFNVSRLAAERMSRRTPEQGTGLRGCLIHTASIAAYEGQIGQVAYAASKGGVVAMTLPMARELAPLGIRVMAIAPGLFETPLLDGLPDAVKAQLGKMVPCPNRLGNPDEFGELVGSILSIPTLNGSVIRLDGALRMPP